MSSNFSLRLQALRKSKGMTQSELARAFNIKRSTLSGYETEGKEPDYKLLCRMAEYFGCSTDYLLGVTDYRNHSDEVLYRDSFNFSKHYSDLPPELQSVVSKICDDFYVLITRDIRTENSVRLSLYADLFSCLRETRASIKGLIERSANTMDPSVLSEVMSLQNTFKSDVSVILDNLVQADIQSVLKPTGKKNVSESQSAAGA